MCVKVQKTNHEINDLFFIVWGEKKRCPSTLPCTSSSSSVRSMTEPLGRAPGAAALVGVDPVAWLSEERENKM